MTIAIRILILLGILLADSGYLYANQPTLQIDGTFSSIDPTGKETHWTDFTVFVSGDKYRVSNLYFNGELLMNGSDGTNSYFVNKMTKAKQLITNWWEWGSVSAGQFPAKDLTAGQLCWLAFASSDYFITQTNATLPLETFQQNADFLHCDMMLSTNQNHLPYSIKWYGSNFWYLRSTNASDRVSVPYTNGFLAGELTVTSITNFRSLEFPLSFDLDVYIPSFMGIGMPNKNDNKGTKDVTLVEITRGRVNSIKSFGTIEDFRPELGSRAQIADFRIPSATNGNYLRITRLNGKWPEPGDADFARTLDVARLTKNSTATPPPQKHVKVVVILAMVSSLIAFLFIVRKITNNK